MKATCPKCNTSLPEQDGLEYRFCPRCGAEITAPKAQAVDNFQTIPPDLNDTVGQRRERTADPQIVEMHPATPINQTLEPVIAEKSTTRPEIVPPPGPPPSSFYRADAFDPKSRFETKQGKHVKTDRKLLTLFMATIGLAVILMCAIYFIFLT